MNKLYRTEKEQIKLVRKYPYGIYLIEKPSEKVQLASVKKYCYTINYIKNPSEKAQLVVLYKNAKYIRYINNPSESVIKYAIENGATKENIENNETINIDNLSDELKLKIMLM